MIWVAVRDGRTVQLLELGLDQNGVPRGGGPNLASVTDILPAGAIHVGRAKTDHPDVLDVWMVEDDLDNGEIMEKLRRGEIRFPG